MSLPLYRAVCSQISAAVAFWESRWLARGVTSHIHRVYEAEGFPLVSILFSSPSITLRGGDPPLCNVPENNR